MVHQEFHTTISCKIPVYVAYLSQFLIQKFCFSWHNQGLKNRLQENNALGAVLKRGYMYSSAQLHAKTGIERVSTAMKKSLYNIVYQGLHNIGAPAYNEMFNLATHTRELRSLDQMLAANPKCNTMFGENNMAYRGAIYWNQLPLYIKLAESIDSFTRLIKTYGRFDL